MGRDPGKEETSLKDKVAVVTGAARWIGKEIAGSLARAGAAVVLCDILEQEGMAAAEEIRTGGGQARFRRADVSRPEDMEELAREAVESYGRLDIWVNNAKTDAFGRVTELAPEAWDRLFATCLKGAFLGAKYAIPRMLATGGGVLINIASVHALVSYPASPAYDAAKAGLVR